jgi:hypothetical protein
MDDTEKTYKWEWDGTGTAPSRVFTQSMDISIGAMHASAPVGVYAFVERSIKIGLYDPNTDLALSGNPNPFSNVWDYPNGVTSQTEPSTTVGNSTVDLVKTLIPDNTYGPYIIEVKLKGSTVGYSSMGSYGPTDSVDVNSGRQKIVPGTSTLTTP